MNKKKIIIIISILVVLLVIAGLYGTFATDETLANNAYDITLTGSTGEILVPAGEVKTALYQVTNTNKGVVKYGVAYSGTDIIVKVYNDSIDEVTGNIDYGETKFVKLYIENTGTTDSIASIQAVLGYEHGGDLTPAVPSGYTLVSEVYSPPTGPTVASFISDLYANATKTTATNNGITYNYASELGLMNDRLGDANVGADDGNIRYYGANPNNYIYFNCETYPDTNCETWRIIGLFKDIEMADDSTQDLIKIARASTLDTTMKWNSAGTNDWTSASLNTYLNGEYYTGLKNDTTRNMIAEVVWNLGGGTDSNIYSNASYANERGTAKCSSCTYETKWPGKIALMYPSDYGYATDFTGCTSSLQLYSNSGCYDNDWLYQTSTLQWLLTPRSDYSDVAWYVRNSGFVTANATGPVNTAFGIRPVLFLDSELGVDETVGDGTSTDPYRIKIS